MDHPTVPDQPRLLRLAELVTEARLAQGWSQIEAADRADISKGSWQNIERAARLDGRPFRPTAGLLKAVAGVLEDLDLAELLDLAGVNPKAPRGAGRPAGRNTPSEIQRLAEKLPAHQRTIIADLMRSIVEPEGREVAESPRTRPVERPN